MDRLRARLGSVAGPAPERVAVLFLENLGVRPLDDGRWIANGLTVGLLRAGEVVSRELLDPEPGEPGGGGDGGQAATNTAPI